MMPTVISSSETIILRGEAELLSESRTAERITPKTGFMKPKTDIRDTGLYFRRMPQTVKAAAEMKARYPSITAPLSPACPMLPPENIPKAVIAIPPIRNWYPLNITGSSVFENLFENEADIPYDAAESSISPSPDKRKLRSSPDERLMITTPANPIMHPMIFFGDGFSCLNIRVEKIMAKKTFDAVMIELFIPVVLASPR